MNIGPQKAAAFASEIKKATETSRAEVVLCVPFVDLQNVADAVKGSALRVGAQNMHFMEEGAYTGEISAPMLAEIGVGYVIVGHSERRAYFAETDETVNKKVLKAIECGIVPIICVGESLEQRDRGVTVDLVRMQTKIALGGVPGDKAEFVIAYEPIWAIGTGRTATSEQAEEVCLAIRSVLGELYCVKKAESTRILYGGSVTPENASELFSMPDIDGGLVGGASIKPTFERIVNFG